MTQFSARDLLQHEREKATGAESVSKPALRLLHLNTFVLELCQRYCEGANDSGAQLQTTHAIDVMFDRGMLEHSLL